MDNPMNRKHKYFTISGIVSLLLLAAFFRWSGKKVRAGANEPSTIRPVAVALVKSAPILNKVTLSGEFVPFEEVDVHAKVSGYIRKIYVDLGDHVKAGQVLALLELPELSAQVQGAEAAVRRSQDAVQRAKSDLARAESLYVATHLDYTRLKEASLARPGLIAEQELDDVQAKDKEGEAQISADEAAFSEAQNQLSVAAAQHRQLTAMSDYTRIVAPFNGVITRRNVDTGALVQAGTGSSTEGVPVASVAETDLFRLTLPVPESAVRSIRLGTTVKVHVGALDRDFEGKIARFSNALDSQTRTMHTEVDVHNKDGSIVQGMYAEVALNLTQSQAGLVVPVQAVTRDGPKATVLVVNSFDRIEPREVQLGSEGTNTVQVLSGLNANDRVVIGSASEFQPGEQVAPKLTAESDEGRF
jgi:RND family efflux transporter MFP subunit